MKNLMGLRKVLVTLAAFVACVWRPEVAPSISIISIAFLGAHAAADWKGKNATTEAG